MGARFDIEHINFIAYVTAKGAKIAPRCEEQSLRKFLYSLADVVEIRRRTISTDATWQDRLQQQALSLANRLAMNNTDRIMSRAEVASLLDPLKKFFTGYALYALLIPGKEEDQVALDRAYKHYVENSALDILVLMPYSSDAFVNIVDPFPASRCLAQRPISPPAVVFWTQSEESVAFTLDEADQFFTAYVARGGTVKRTVRGLQSRIKAESKRLAAKTILHISDLHFGDSLANRRRRILKQHLRKIAPNADRVVISGDLFDEPNLEPKELFDEFHEDLSSWSKKVPILVLGNHDVRTSGNKLAGFGGSADQAVDVGFQPIVVDDDLEVVFFCFHSSEGGNFATGSVSESQRISRGSAFDRMMKDRPSIANYMRVAVVHHHPYTYESQPTVFYEKILNLLSRKEDRFVAFKNADEFLAWCGARDVSLILHGHKHVPHVVKANLIIRDKPKEILIVGCGSTTGVENRPMCYDIVSLDPSTRKWGVVFYSDPTSDGAGFVPENVSLDLRTELPARA